MKPEKRFSVKVVRLTAHDTFVSQIIFETDYREIANHIAEEENGTVVDNYMSNENLIMREDSNYLAAIYNELEWYIVELEKATQDPSTPQHHIEYLSHKINGKMKRMTEVMTSITKASQRKGGN